MTSVSVGFEGGGELGKRTRRHWSPEEKRRLVALTHEPNASIASVARRHDLNANLLFNWRRQLGRQALALSDRSGAMAFAPIEVVPEPRRDERASGSGLMEVELADGTKVRVDAQVDELALRRVLAALKAVA
jgi:transposase